MPCRFWHEEKDYLPRYRELVKAVREKTADFNPSTVQLKNTIMALAFEQPEVVGETLKEETVSVLVKAALEDELREIEKKQRDLREKEKDVSWREAKLQNLEPQLSRREKALEIAEKQFNDAVKAFNEALESFETPEMKDRVRAYALFKLEAEKHIETAANQTAYIAGCASILSGAESQAISSMKAPKPFSPPQRRY